MLRIGQKVQIAKDAWDFRNNRTSSLAGEITFVTKYLGIIKYPIHGALEMYNVDLTGDKTISREVLWPIDDEPCEAEFLEEFMKEKMNV